MFNKKLLDKLELFEESKKLKKLQKLKKLEELKQLEQPKKQEILEQLEELEKLLTTLTEKFQQLKQEITTVVADDSHPPEPELSDSENWEDQFIKNMLIPDNLMYEELKDPGDWEQLKKEFAATQDIIISELEEIVESVPDWDINSMPDPWNQ